MHNEQQCAGVVHHDKLYLPMRPFPNLQGLTDGMRIFEPVRQEWTVLSVNVWPTAWAKQLLAATEDYLVQFGGMVTANTTPGIWQKGATGLVTPSWHDTGRHVKPQDLTCMLHHKAEPQGKLLLQLLWSVAGRSVHLMLSYR